MSATNSSAEAARLAPTDPPGRMMATEIAEQPAILRRLLEEGAPRIRTVAAETAARGPRKHPRAAAPGRDPQPVRHRSPELQRPRRP